MIPYLKCVLMVAAATGLPPHVLPTIQAVEGGLVGITKFDANGTADLGVMQVNTIWVPALTARTGLPEAVVEQRLIEDPCFNIAASALILRVYLRETHGELLSAIGDYHSHTPRLNGTYVVLAEQKARELFANSQQ